ncbi:hypothetical protein EYZ11_008055 [Aspergillus tanneri]|uniref:DNA repair protein rad4 n=1 Tax=Aspergillus tanneri TaxID=1220188 RepID=A0A4V3UNT5_9EURO|nr:hypothetical protein EYZ11_008055 [Aspergillus tanneri]
MLDPEVILSREDFQKQARTLKGSRDFGAQLFCALLRSVAVEARLVCSLQPLPFSGITKNVSPVKLNLQYISLSSDMYDTSTDEQSGSPASPTPPSKSRRLARPQFRASRPFKTTVAASRPSTRESAYPVFWVEALNEAVQKWIPVDPLVTKSLAKTFKFEPPSSDPYNVMSYVVAFEDDASMRDVTRRYAKAFNAKTRKLRVESTKGGEAWWKRVLLFYEKPFLEDRDEMEISELTAKTAAEPMPRNVADFKDHPIYALERHLRRNEVIFPKRVIGQVGLGKSGSTHEKLEPVYRRSDVHVLRSADKWYRLGREIKIGEQPLKRVPARGNNILDDEDSETVTETSLYSFSQTELYRPPPVIQGKIPKNVYGNLDIYVSTMVPPGGVHVKHSDAAHAARILGIDYADAVTGFDFKGRHGTAVFQGAVVASEYHEALNEVLQGLEYEKANAKQEERSAEALRFWRYFLLKLRIAERVKGYAIEGEEAEDEEDGGMSDDSYANSEDYGGGFIPELDQLITTPQAGLDSTKLVSQEPSTENNTLPDSRIEDACRGGFLLDKDTNQRITLRSDGNSGPTSRNHLTERPRYSLVVIPNDKIDGLEENVSRKDTSVSPKASNFDLQQQNMKSADDEANNMQGSLEAPIMVESSTGADSKSTSVEVLSRAPSQTQSRVPSPEASEDESGSNEGSLLSHDPEDDDAIPEWLMSD